MLRPSMVILRSRLFVTSISEVVSMHGSMKRLRSWAVVMIRWSWLHKVNWISKGLTQCVDSLHGWNRISLVEDSAHTVTNVFQAVANSILTKSYICARLESKKKHAQLITIVMQDCIVRLKKSTHLGANAPNSGPPTNHATRLKSANITCTAGFLYPWRKRKSACQCTLNRKNTTTVGNPSQENLNLPSKITSSTVNIVRLVLPTTTRTQASVARHKVEQHVQCVPKLILWDSGKRTLVMTMRKFHGSSKKSIKLQAKNLRMLLLKIKTRNLMA